MSSADTTNVQATVPAAGQRKPRSGGSTAGTFNSAIRSWLQAMDKAKRIKPGGRLVFVNRRTGSAVPVAEADSRQVGGVE